MKQGGKHYMIYMLKEYLAAEWEIKRQYRPAIEATVVSQVRDDGGVCDGEK